MMAWWISRFADQVASNCYLFCPPIKSYGGESQVGLGTTPRWCLWPSISAWAEVAPFQDGLKEMALWNQTSWYIKGCLSISKSWYLPSPNPVARYHTQQSPWSAKALHFSPTEDTKLVSEEVNLEACPEDKVIVKVEMLPLGLTEGGSCQTQLPSRKIIQVIIPERGWNRQLK